MQFPSLNSRAAKHRVPSHPVPSLGSMLAAPTSCRPARPLPISVQPQAWENNVLCSLLQRCRWFPKGSAHGWASCTLLCRAAPRCLAECCSSLKEKSTVPRNQVTEILRGSRGCAQEWLLGGLVGSQLGLLARELGGSSGHCCQRLGGSVLKLTPGSLSAG